MKASRRNKLRFGARFSLFIVSYLPLFFIMSFSQIYSHKEYLNWGGWNKDGIENFIKYFGAVSVIFIMSVIGIFGFLILISKVKKRCKTNGIAVKIIDIENKNSESITYLFTYLIPFVFQDLSSCVNVVSILVLLVVTFMIYVNSGMILINPTISMKYTLYQISYENIENKTIRNGMIITESRYLEEGDILDIEDVGHKLFYADFIEEANVNS